MFGRITELLSMFDIGIITEEQLIFYLDHRENCSEHENFIEDYMAIYG